MSSTTEEQVALLNTSIATLNTQIENLQRTVNTYQDTIAQNSNSNKNFYAEIEKTQDQIQVLQGNISTFYDIINTL